MSRSTKLPIIKDRPRNYKKSSAYWRRVRHIQKQYMHSDYDIPNHRQCVNYYDYEDYKFYITKDNKYYKKAKRK